MKTDFQLFAQTPSAQRKIDGIILPKEGLLNFFYKHIHNYKRNINPFPIDYQTLCK